MAFDVVERANKKNNFNLVRFIASLMVIYGHMFPLLGIPSFTWLNSAISTLGVYIFFIISGFLITGSFLRDSNLLRYVLRRIFRIFPGLVALILITTFIIGPIVSDYGIIDYFKGNYLFYLRNIFLFINYHLPGVFQTNPYPGTVNGSLWSLPVEILMYAFLPIVLIFGFRITKKYEHVVLFGSVFFIILYICKYLFFPQWIKIVYGTNIADIIPLAGYFFVGSLFYFPKYRRLLDLQIASVLLFIFSCLSLSYGLQSLLLFFIFPYFILSFSLTPMPFFSNWFIKNDLSYGIYLYGFLVQQLLIDLLGAASFSINIFALISILITMFLGYFSWNLIEKPSQLIGKNIISSLVLKKER